MVTKLESREEKREIMWRKKGLKRGVYIDDDLTKDEREETEAGRKNRRKQEDRKREIGEEGRRWREGEKR